MKLARLLLAALAFFPALTAATLAPASAATTESNTGQPLYPGATFFIKGGGGGGTGYCGVGMDSYIYDAPVAVAKVLAWYNRSLGSDKKLTAHNPKAPPIYAFFRADGNVSVQINAVGDTPTTQIVFFKFAPALPASKWSESLKQTDCY